MKLKEFIEVYDDAYLVVIDEPFEAVYYDGEHNEQREDWEAMGYKFNFVDKIPDFLYEREVHCITAYEVEGFTYFCIGLI